MSQTSLWSGDPKIEAALVELAKMPRFPSDPAVDVSWLRDLIDEYPTVDVVEEIKKWRTWMLEHESRRKVNYRARFRNWCKRSAEWQSRPRTGWSSGSSKANAGAGLSARPDGVAAFGPTSTGLEQW
jgi:hypothetical protein